jgi:hypothetical protein
LIEQIGTISCADDEDAFAAIAHTVELGEQLRYNTVHDTAAITLVSTLRCHRVQFIEEHNARPSVTGSLEDTPDVGFRFTNVHVEQLWALDTEEVERELCSDGLCEEGFASSRGSVEEDTAALFHALGEKLRTGEG